MDRNTFLKLFGLTSFSGLFSSNTMDKISNRSHVQKFNMHGYGAPKLDNVRIGFIGIGSRGSSNVTRYSQIKNVDIVALCDIVPGRVEKSIAKLKKTFPSHNPVSYTSEKSWMDLCERDDIDLIIISTPWSYHAKQAAHAMNHGKHVGVDVPAATTVEECWKLIETSEETQKHCIILENACYNEFYMLILNMVRKGFFGDIIHGEGGYIHDRVSGDDRWKRDPSNNNWFKFRPWRLQENVNRNGNLYPCHGVAPICQAMNINYGDKLEYLVSMSGEDFSMSKKIKEVASGDDFFKPYVGLKFRGNMNISLIRTYLGRTIVLQHDVSSPRPNVRANLYSGTKGIAQQRPFPSRISTSHSGWLSEDEYNQLNEKYKPIITRKFGEIAKNFGGHGGVDSLLAWRTVDCLRNGLPPDLNVYDAASWSVLGPLSEWSVANGSRPIQIPDFTNGSWKTNSVGMDINLVHGGNTEFLH